MKEDTWSVYKVTKVKKYDSESDKETYKLINVNSREHQMAH